MKGVAVGLAALLLVEGCAASVGRTASSNISTSEPTASSGHTVWPYWLALGVAAAAATTVGIGYLIIHAFAKDTADEVERGFGGSSNGGSGGDSPHVLAFTVTR